MPPPSLDDDFLDRVRRSYRLGIVLGERAGSACPPRQPFFSECQWKQLATTPI